MAEKIKKVLIVSHAMELGGAERSLLGLLETFDPTICQVDLFLQRHTGELLKYIPENVNLIPEVPAYTVLARPMKDVLKESHGLLTIARMYGKLKALIYDKHHHTTESGVALEYSHKYTYRLMPAIQPAKKYDLAISFLTPHYIVSSKVNAIKKLAWIHTDYSNITIDVPSEKKMWAAYDYIASISETVSMNFEAVFPDLKEKIVLIENVLPEMMIKQQADEFGVSIEMPEDEAINLLSVGRFCNPKNFDNVPDICARLVCMGHNVRWYLIGYGGDEALIRSKIVQFGMTNHVIILGKKDNPYPYIKACDFYVQPSRYEGKSVAVREAQMLGKPVIITRYSTSSSQIEDGVDGVIVPMDNENCAKSISDILINQGRRATIIINCRNRNYSNVKEVEKLYELMKGDNDT